MENNRYLLRMALFTAAYYITNSIYQSYMSLYYTSKRFSSMQIGAINACVALFSLLGQPLWGSVADRSTSRRRVIALLCTASSCIALAFTFTGSFIHLILLAGIFAFFYTAIQPMGDAVILDKLNESGRPFGPLRLYGCAAFALSGFIFGRIMDARASSALVPLSASALCLLTGLSAFLLPLSTGGRSAGGRRMSIVSLLRHRNLVRLLCLMAPVQITMGYFYTFFSPHFMDLSGANARLLGACYLISAACEVPFLLTADRLFDRFGAGRLMCTAALALSVRWSILAFARTAYAAMFSQIFHGWGFIVMTVCMAKYISRTVPKGLQASGQMLLAIVSFGIARITGNLGGGLLAEAIGRQNVFFVCAGLCLAAACIFVPGYLRRPPLNGRSSDENAPSGV